MSVYTDLITPLSARFFAANKQTNKNTGCLPGTRLPTARDGKLAAECTREKQHTKKRARQLIASFAAAAGAAGRRRCLREALNRPGGGGEIPAKQVKALSRKALG